MTLDLDAIRACLEGAIPGVMATCAADGTPNVTYISQVEYVDAAHLALSFQFFNKTRRNVLANPVVELLVIHPQTGAMFRIGARYLRTEDQGPVFERMKAKLAGIASHTGMGGVFRLRGADLYAVTSIDAVGAPVAAHEAPPPRLRLPLLRRCAERLAGCGDFGALVETLLDAVEFEFGIPHAMLLWRDAGSAALYTVASRGYGDSGAGSEIALGQGVIGVAAACGTPIRINHVTQETSYSRAMGSGGARGEREIPLPGLAAPGSQLALPLRCGGEVMGVLFVESPHEMRFGWDDEDALATLAAPLALHARALQACSEGPEPAPSAAPPESPPPACSEGGPHRVRFYEADGSVFLDDAYLIKGVAGAVLWKLLSEHAASGRVDFSNRELRLAPELRLPEVADNLEARLLLLSRRLQDRTRGLRLERTGRGRLRLCLAQPPELQFVPRG
jgi:hypothetical protein